MSGPHTPPPGSMPPGVGAPDMASMEDMLAAQGGASAAKSGSSPGSGAAHGGGTHHQPARPLGSPVQEAKNIAGGVGGELFEFLPPVIKNLISAKPDDSPEDAARKRQMLQNYQKLNAEDQQFVQKKLQHEQMEKQQREQEEAQRRQQEAAMQSNDLPVPEGKKTGEAAMGGGKSQKSQTISKLQNDRKKLSSSG